MPKSERLQQIEHLLLAHPEGLRRAEIARRLGVNRSTISRDVDALSHAVPITESDDARLRLDRRGYLTTIRLTMFELEALHLAARLFARVMKFPFPHASAALRKLADAQGRVSLRLADRIRETADEIERFPLRAAVTAAQYRTVVEQLGTAITENRPVRVVYYARQRGRDAEYRLFPLTLEPHHEGRAVHLLAWELPPPHRGSADDGEPTDTDAGGFRTLKIERIRAITLEEPAPAFLETIPQDEIAHRLARAWSIWTTEEQPEEVELRFSAAVADRVAETLWHGSQHLDAQPDGSVVWRGAVSAPREMYPWIRGWGPDVEVLAPQWLREEHRRDFERGVALYRNSASDGVEIRRDRNNTGV